MCRITVHRVSSCGQGAAASEALLGHRARSDVTMRAPIASARPGAKGQSMQPPECLPRFPGSRPSGIVLMLSAAGNHDASRMLPHPNQSVDHRRRTGAQTVRLPCLIDHAAGWHGRDDQSAGASMFDVPPAIDPTCPRLASACPTPVWCRPGTIQSVRVRVGPLERPAKPRYRPRGPSLERPGWAGILLGRNDSDNLSG